MLCCCVVRCAELEVRQSELESWWVLRATLRVATVAEAAGTDGRFEITLHKRLNDDAGCAVQPSRGGDTAIVTSVAAGGPAHVAGVLAGDEVTSILHEPGAPPSDDRSRRKQQDRDARPYGRRRQGSRQ